MKKTVLLLVFFSSFVFGANQCIVCHKGIEDIRDRNSSMMQEILKVADKAGHPENDCIVCHGGNPKSKSRKYAHRGTVKYFKEHKGPKSYYAKPTNPSVNQNSCGICHEKQVDAQKNSLMMTEQGNMHSLMWSFGVKKDYKHSTGNYNTKNPDDLEKRLGTPEYRAYMQELTKSEPEVFVSEIKELDKNASLSLNRYLHKNLSKKDNLSVLGCASCHIPYSSKGFYEGNDRAIKKKERGHMLSHQIQSSRKVKVKIHDVEYSGVPVATCAKCHTALKHTGTSYQGVMESQYPSPLKSKEQKHFLHMKEDIHYKKGMLCQDCHTSNDLHGDGFLAGASLGAVEIECQDCHGTTKKYPWELPLGYSDEFNKSVKTEAPRGVVKNVAEYLKQGYLPREKGDGYLLTARGNPLVKAVKKENKIIIHLASGKNIELKPLKLLKEQKRLSKKALTAMDSISAHMDTMECYTCHATWAPQYYGLNIKLNYRNAKVTESVAYIRWEDPALAQNGEGRITPVIPGYQTTLSFIAKDGKRVIQNHIFKVANVEGAGDEGQNAIDMTPVQPHTIQKESRSCESCHTSAKALGLGVGGGALNADPSKSTIIDIMSAERELLPKKLAKEIPPIANLKHDYSQFIDKNGTQLMSVGNHWRLSGPLNKEQRERLDRRGVCLSCHVDIPEGNLAISAMTHIAEMAELEIDNKEHQSILNKIVNLAAVVQIIGTALFILLLLYIIYTVFIKKKPINPRNRGWK